MNFLVWTRRSARLLESFVLAATTLKSKVFGLISAKWAEGIGLTLLMLLPAGRVFADGDNPFELGTSVANNFANNAKTLAIAIATLALIGLIIAAMAGRFYGAWMARICVGMICIAGITWIVGALQGHF